MADNCCKYDVLPSRCARSSFIKTSAHAPSFMPGAFPAVIVPSFPNAGRSFDSVSSDVSRRGASSVSTFIGSPRRCAISTGTISSANKPLSIALVHVHDCEVPIHLVFHVLIQTHLLFYFRRCPYGRGLVKTSKKVRQKSCHRLSGASPIFKPKRAFGK